MSSTFKTIIKHLLASTRFGRTPRRFCLIVGSPRSGTTALGDWLGTQAGIADFNETRTLVALYRYSRQVQRFRDLKADEQFLNMQARDEALRYYAQRAYLRGRVLIDKEPLEPVAFPDERYEDFLVHMRLVFPEIYFLFIIRDPLATVWSMTHRKWGYSLVSGKLRELSIEDAVKIWTANAELIRKYANAERCYTIRFESLITDPAESQRIADFLGVSMQSAFQSKPTKQHAFSEQDRDYILQQTAKYRPEFGY